MTRIIECPACEADVPHTGPLGELIACPFCRHQFAPSSTLARDAVIVAERPVLTESLPVPRIIAALRNREEVVPPIHESVVEQVAKPFEIQGPVALRLASPDKRGKSRAGLWLSIGCVLFLAVGGVFLTWVSFRRADLRAESRPRTSAPAAPAVSSEDMPSQSKPKESPIPVDAPRESPAPGLSPSAERNGGAVDIEREWSSLDANPREEVLALWTRIQPYLVRLDVRVGSVERLVGGVIIDSRGYVATSYQAIRDAQSIQVRLAAKSLTAGEAVGDLSDEVRGLIGADESRDLAILQINRRFVSAFANLALDVKTRALPGDRCVVAVPPSPTRRLWLVDFPIRQAQPFDRLLEPLRNALTQRKLVIPAESPWLVGSLSAEQFVPGSPVFNLQAELVGLCVAAAPDQQTIAAVSAPIAGLLGQGNLAARPFPIDPAVVAQVAAETSDASLLPDAESPAFAPADTLRKSTQAVIGFHVFPQSPEQFQSLAQFASASIEVDDWLSSQDLEEASWKMLRDYRDAVFDRLQAALDANEDPLSAAEQLNRWVCDSATAARGFAALGRVLRVGSDGRNGTPFVVFELPGTERYAYAEIRREGPIFLPGSLWLIVGRQFPGVTFRSTDGAIEVDAQVCDIRYVVSCDPSGE